MAGQMDVRASSVDELLSLYRGEDKMAFRWAKAPAEVWLEFLHRHPDAAWEIAISKRLPDTVQGVLAQHPDPLVRRNVVIHNRVSAAALQLLASDSDPFIRAAVAEHAVPESLLERLANDIDEDVRASVAMNQSTPRPIVEKLADDPSEWVAQKAREQLNAST